MAALAAYSLHAIVVGGGSGTRFGADRPKQFLSLAGKPILAHTLTHFLQYNQRLSVTLVLPATYIAYWQAEQAQCLSAEACARVHFVAGGTTRTDSVRNGLNALTERTTDAPQCLVAVQDAVRPFAHRSMLQAAFASAAENGTGVAAVPSKSSLRRKTENGSVAVDRAEYYAVQTPQVFRLPILVDAYQKSGNQSFTDDASLVEAAGYPVHLVTGGYDNLKITTPEDLALAELLLPAFYAKEGLATQVKP